MTTPDPFVARPNRPTGRRGPFARLHRCEQGQSIFVVILFFFLLAGLLFLVLNTGNQLNSKVAMQTAADAVAATGAGWFARGMNTIAMCNVAETQLLSMIVLLDALETVVPPAAECIDDLVMHIGSSEAGHDIPIDDRIIWLAVGNAASEQEIIQQFADLVDDIPMDDYLAYDNGVLWECVKLLDGFSHAMRDAAPLAAQREAMDIAKELAAEFGFLVPFWPELPVRDGQFEDFRNPMRTGHLPEPDEKEYIGGFDWHTMDYRGYNYRRYGPWGYWREPFVRTRPMGLFDISRFSVLFNIVSDMKFEMLFGDTDDKVSLYEWEMDYDEAKQLTDEEVRRAWWERTSFSCRYPFPTAGFFSNIELRHLKEPTPSTRTYGNMNSPNLSSYTRADQAYEGADPRLAVWYRVQERKTAHFPQLGIFAPHPPYYPDGSPWHYTEAEKQVYYYVTLYRFNGAELDTDTTLHRRYLPPAGLTPFLGPILLDRTVGDNKLSHIRARYTFNGFAYRSGKVRDWSERFINPNPIEELVAYAQARVFCRWSWDLFTQDWKVKLVRTDRWDDVLPLLDGAIPSEGAEVARKLDDEHLEPVRKMLQAYDEEFVKEVTH